MWMAKSQLRPMRMPKQIDSRKPSSQPMATVHAATATSTKAIDTSASAVMRRLREESSTTAALTQSAISADW